MLYPPITTSCPCKVTVQCPPRGPNSAVVVAEAQEKSAEQQSAWVHFAEEHTVVGKTRYPVGHVKFPQVGFAVQQSAWLQFDDEHTVPEPFVEYSRGQLKLPQVGCSEQQSSA
eukprot:RCo054331